MSGDPKTGARSNFNASIRSCPVWENEIDLITSAVTVDALNVSCRSWAETKEAKRIETETKNMVIGKRISKDTTYFQ